jgi:hypothetical protein
MTETSILINHARIKLGISQDFQCFDNPTNEEQYNSQVRWIVGEDEHRNAVYGDTQLVTWQQVVEYATEAEQQWKMNLLRRERDKLLAETDWMAVSDRTMTQQQIAYRQALRDLPDNSTPTLTTTGELDKSSVTWPVKPK